MSVLKRLRDLEARSRRGRAVVLCRPLELLQGEPVAEAWARQYPGEPFNAVLPLTEEQWEARWGDGDER